MKDLCQYGNRPEDEWEILPWIPDPRPPFKIWVKPEQIAPFFLIPHHPYALSLLLKISDGFRTEEFCRLGLTGSSGDWERLVRSVIREFEEITRRGSVSLRLRRGCVLRVLPIHRRFDAAVQNDPGGL